MSDIEKKRVVGSQPAGMTSAGFAPTGANLDSSGSSVETDEDIATSEDLPSTEEILQMAEERRKREGRKPET
jgi:hypothetical protein